MWKRGALGSATEAGTDAQWPLPQQDTVILATESPVAAEGDPFADQVKTRWSIESYASKRSASEITKENTRTHQTYSS